MLQLNDTSAVAREGLLARMKSGDGGCLFSGGQRSDRIGDEVVMSELVDGKRWAHSPSATDEVAPQVAVTGDDHIAQGKRRKAGVFARMRSKRTSKEVTTDVPGLMEQSSSDRPVETIPPAPGS